MDDGWRRGEGEMKWREKRSEDGTDRFMGLGLRLWTWDTRVLEIGAGAFFCGMLLSVIFLMLEDRWMGRLRVASRVNSF